MREREILREIFEREREERERRQREKQRREREALLLKAPARSGLPSPLKEALLLKAPARSGLPSPFNSKDKATKTFFPWDGDFLVDSCTFWGGLWGGLVQKAKMRLRPHLHVHGKLS